MAQIAGMIAEEIGADVRITKIATLLHDVGKAVSHKIEASTITLGRNWLVNMVWTGKIATQSKRTTMISKRQLRGNYCSSLRRGFGRTSRCA